MAIDITGLWRLVYGADDPARVRPLDCAAYPWDIRLRLKPVGTDRYEGHFEVPASSIPGWDHLYEVSVFSNSPAQPSDVFTMVTHYRSPVSTGDLDAIQVCAGRIERAPGEQTASLIWGFAFGTNGNFGNYTLCRIEE